MLVTVDTSSIPAESFNVIARKNATNRIARRCPVSDPNWLTSLLAGGCVLQLEGCGSSGWQALLRPGESADIQFQFVEEAGSDCDRLDHPLVGCAVRDE